ncbi:MAG TPA: tetratricopeptide repeat protein [Candidatus Polarisedimenticolia bacterium]|nr:tetratricopeptide repeat protein [Candidatus Polarisedimenticolia bacterium]
MAEIDDAIAAYERGDYAAARKGLERTTRAGDAVAARYLAIMHRAGQGVKQSDRQAATYFRRAADAGDLLSQINLAELYESGRGIRRNYPAAADWYRRAADQGSPLAMARLAGLREKGLDSTADLAEAAVWYRRAAELGEREAQARVAGLYAEGRGVERNLIEALIWAEEAAAGNADARALRDRLTSEMPAAAQAEAWFRLAMMQSAGVPAGHGQDAILTNFQRAAEGGHMQAMRRLALCYLDGKEGAARDWTAAAGWLRKAAEAGSIESGLGYAAMLFGGEGVARDPAAALPWAKRAVEAGLADAPVLLGAIERALAVSAADPLTPPPAKTTQKPTPAAMLTDGVANDPLTPADLSEEAARIPTAAVVQADPNDALGQTALGLDYYFGRNGRPRDLTNAAKWLLRAANNGALAAQHNLSVMYAHGQGLRVDPAEGARWCRIAAERGDQRSQFRMSYLYFHGQGVTQDVFEALYWAELAARQGHRGAVSTRDELAARATAQQIADIRHRAENFRPKA